MGFFFYIYKKEVFFIWRYWFKVLNNYVVFIWIYCYFGDCVNVLWRYVIFYNLKKNRFKYLNNYKIFFEYYIEFIECNKLDINWLNILYVYCFYIFVN